MGNHVSVSTGGVAPNSGNTSSLVVALTVGTIAVPLSGAGTVSASGPITNHTGLFKGDIISSPSGATSAATVTASNVTVLGKTYSLSNSGSNKKGTTTVTTVGASTLPPHCPAVVVTDSNNPELFIFGTVIFHLVPPTPLAGTPSSNSSPNITATCCFPEGKFASHLIHPNGCTSSYSAGTSGGATRGPGIVSSHTVVGKVGVVTLHVPG